MSIIERARQLRKTIESLSSNLPDETALENVELFPNWKAGVAYVVDQRVQHESYLYKCVQSHTSQSDWSPQITPALWTLVSIDEWPEWIQPTGAHNAYMFGDKVSHSGQHWISLIDNNVWEPGAAGTESLWSVINGG